MSSSWWSVQRSASLAAGWSQARKTSAASVVERYAGAEWAACSSPCTSPSAAWLVVKTAGGDPARSCRGDFTGDRIGDRGRGSFEDEQLCTGDLVREGFAVADWEDWVAATVHH